MHEWKSALLLHHLINHFTGDRSRCAALEDWKSIRVLLKSRLARRLLIKGNFPFQRMLDHGLQRGPPLHRYRFCRSEKPVRDFNRRLHMGHYMGLWVIVKF